LVGSAASFGRAVHHEMVVPMPLALSEKAMSWLKPYIERFRPLAKDAAALSFFINLLGLAAPIFVLQIYDRVVFRAGLSTLAALTIGMVIACAFEFVLRQARAKMMQRVALTTDVEVSRALFDKVLSVPLQTLESRPTAYWKLLFRDVEVVRNTLSGPTALLAVDAPFSLLFLLLIFIIAWPVAWVLVAILACFVALSWRSGHAVSGAAAREMTAAVQRDVKLEEFLAQRATVKSLAMGGRLREVWEDAQHGAITQSIVRGVEADTAGSLGQLLTVIATVAMTAVGALAIIDQNLTIGGLIAANMLAGRLLAPMNQLVGAWRSYTSFKQSADRLADAFTLTDDLHQSPVALVRPRGRIELDKLHFGYPGQAVIIEDLDLTIEHGGIHGILGLNGSGKTTLLKLIMGLYRPIKGRVLLDGADIAQFARDDLARWIGFVPQDCVLLGGTIRENIALGRPHATDEQIVHAATLAQAHAAIAALPNGYGTAVGEGGSQLSGGMRQRISIARALLGDPPVIVMDEPTSSLDRQAEEGLKDALAALAAKHTIILVTHSPVLLQACQRLVVLEAGRIAAQGAPAAVMAALAKQRQAGGVTPLTQSAS
jgi:ATP-binding cassette, subfamily C, bacterial LapB